MDGNMVREAIIEAVKKSHNRYNQCSHRKVSRAVQYYRIIEIIKIFYILQRARQV